MRAASHTLLLSLLVSGGSFAQVVWPEGELPRVPPDGGALTVRTSPGFPIVAVATTLGDGGADHRVVWSVATPQRTWLYAPAQLTFFWSSDGGTLQLTASKGEAHARGAPRWSWPSAPESWSLADLGVIDAPGTRRFLLTEMKGSGCPSTTVEHWLELRGGRVSELLTTGSTGEGGGDTVWFDGTSATWPRADGGVDDRGFGPIADIEPQQRVVVYDEGIEQGVRCRASRTIYRYADGGLVRVRVEHLDAGAPPACSG